jgi:hypothetical protein
MADSKYPILPPGLANNEIERGRKKNERTALMLPTVAIPSGRPKDDQIQNELARKLLEEKLLHYQVINKYYSIKTENLLFLQKLSMQEKVEDKPEDTNEEFQNNKELYWKLKNKEVTIPNFGIEEGKFYFIHTKTNTFESFDKEKGMLWFIDKFADQNYFTTCAGKEELVFHINYGGSVRRDGYAYCGMDMANDRTTTPLTKEFILDTGANITALLREDFNVVKRKECYDVATVWFRGTAFKTKPWTFFYRFDGEWDLTYAIGMDHPLYLLGLNTLSDYTLTWNFSAGSVNLSKNLLY